MRLCLLLLVLCSVGALVRSQADAPASIADPTAWATTEVGDGVVLRQRWFPSLFGSPQSLTVLEVHQGRAGFDLVAPGRRTLTSTMAHSAGALAAINGGFFDIEGTGLSRGLLRLRGALVVPANEGQGCVGIDSAGRLQLAVRPAGDWPEAFAALGAGPMLLTAGAVLDHGPARRRHPRSAIGMTADARVLLLAIDGRTDRAAGMTFEETARVLAALGAVDGLNLDGGGSTTLWVAGRGVCNYPCDNRRYDHGGERAVANALLVRAPAILVIDDAAAEFRGAGWVQRPSGAPMCGSGCAASAAHDCRAVFRIALPFPGRWRLSLGLPAGDASAVPAPVSSPQRVQVYGNQPAARVVPAPGRWVEVGEFVFAAGLPAIVTLASDGDTLVVDALRFVQVPDVTGK